MLKKIFAAAALVLLTACGGTEKTAEEAAELPVTFTSEDLCLYSEQQDGEAQPIIWLGMDKSDIDEKNEYMRCFSESDIAYEPAVNEDGAETEAVKYINYKGGIHKGVLTAKGIYSTGAYPDAEKPSSTAEDLIKAYGIDIENDDAVNNKIDDANYSISLYFKAEEDGSLTRIVPSQGENIVEGDVRVEYVIRFLITDNYVTNIQLMHK